MPGATVAYVDQCMYGQWVQARNGTWALAKKPTRFATNSMHIKGDIERRCDGRHTHAKLMGGVARQAAAYPDELVDAVLAGLCKELQVQGRLEALEGGGVTIDEAPPENEWAEQYYDEITGVLLDPKLVKKAREDEVAFMHKLRVYTQATMAECQSKGLKPIPMRW